jgi:hypothetical protein
MVHDSVDNSMKKLHDILEKEAGKGKQEAFTKGLSRVEETLTASLNKQLDVFEKYALRNVFNVPDDTVFLDGYEADEAVIAGTIEQPFAAIDVALQDVLVREHLNAHLRQTVAQLERALTDLSSATQKLAKATRDHAHNGDAGVLRNMVQSADDLFANMLTTEAELTQQGVPLPARSDDRRRDGHGAVEHTLGDTAAGGVVDELVDFVNTSSSMQ